jgi:iron complex transport system substrate-binding protein
MGHTTIPDRRRLILVIGLIASLAALSCDRTARTAVKAGGGRKVASLTPAATEILIGIGAGDHLVAVSNWESSARVTDLPRVGDYQTTDWETLAKLRPDVMIIQVAPDRVPPGLKQRADELKIELVNVKIDRLEDVFDAMQQLGAVAGERDKGTAAVRALRARFDTIREAAATQPSVRTLVVRDENGQQVIGPDNFLDDILKVVNATNAAAELGKAYPSIDREKIVALKPEAVIVLLPGAKPQSIEASDRFWASLTDVPAVRNHRVSTIVDGYALVPGPHVADLAHTISQRLRPPPTSQPSTQPGKKRP